MDQTPRSASFAAAMCDNTSVQAHMHVVLFEQAGTLGNLHRPVEIPTRRASHRRQCTCTAWRAVLAFAISRPRTE